MYFKKQIYLIICVSLFYFGCKKDAAENVTPPPDNQAQVIHKIKGASCPNQLPLKFHYTADKIDSVDLLLEYMLYDYSTASLVRRNHYHKPNTLLDSTILFVNSKGYPDSGVVYYFQPQSVDTFRCSYDTQGYILTYFTKYNHHFFTYQNSNLTKYEIVEQMGSTVYIQNYTYDTTLFNNTNFELVPKIYGLYLFNKPSKNLVKEFSELFVGSPADNYKVNHTFNSNGYLMESYAFDTTTLQQFTDWKYTY